MSKLDELLRELCPDGVEFLTIGECTLKTKNIKWKTEETSHRYIDLTSVDRDTHKILETTMVTRDNAPSRAQQIVQTGDILFGGTRPMLKRYCLVSEEYDGEVCSTGFCVLRPNTNLIMTNWLYHIISTSDFYAHVEKYQKGASYPAITDAEVKAFSIPVPPLPVQEEIVRILDSFTALTAELTAELTARKKQYDYYKSVVLSKADGGNAYLLNNICQIVDCPHTSPKWQESGIPVIRNFNLSNGTIDTRNLSYVSEEEYQQRVKRIIPQENDILFSREAPIGNVGLIPKGFRCCQGQRVVLLRPDTAVVSPKYLIHFLQSNLVKDQIAKKEGVGATVSNFNIADLRKLSVLVPSMEIQQKIVDILDVFEKYAMVVSAELPKEIEMRKQQYEYYRDKLLSFKEFRNE